MLFRSLKAGKYRFRARFQVRDVVPIDEENLDTVVVGCQYKENWMRLSDLPRKARSGREGGWREVPVEFEVVEDRANVEFLVGIRGKQGSLKVDSNSLVLERL